jgi:hypothetical protein
MGNPINPTRMTVEGLAEPATYLLGVGTADIDVARYLHVANAVSHLLGKCCVSMRN